ncbi:MAG: class I adenylate-forming enzyme family protein [Chloroflexota bacterium]
MSGNTTGAPTSSRLSRELFPAFRARPPGLGSGSTISLLDSEGAWTRDQLSARTQALASQISGSLRRSETAAVVAASSREGVALLLALSAVRQPMALIPASMPESEQQDAWRQSGASVLLVPDCKEAPHIVAMANADATRSPSPPVGGLCLLQFTSGSTGRSRWAARTRRGIDAEMAAVQERIALSAHDRVLCCSSIAHSYGLIGGLLAPLSIGATVALAAPAEAATLARELGPTVIVGLAGTYENLLTHSHPEAWASEARICLSAGAPLPEGLPQRFAAEFGRRIRQDYGTTETGTIAIDTDGDGLRQDVGTPLPHLEVRIHPIHDIPLEDGMEGEIQVRGETVAESYVIGEALEPCTDQDGWYHTGDAGRLVNGRLHLGHRLRPALMWKNGNIRPERLEALIAHMPGVGQVVALPSTVLGDIPGIKIVVATRELCADEIRAWCGRHLPGSMQPDDIEVMAELPRSPAGKVLQKYLL